MFQINQLLLYIKKYFPSIESFTLEVSLQKLSRTPFGERFNHEFPGVKPTDSIKSHLIESRNDNKYILRNMKIPFIKLSSSFFVLLQPSQIIISNMLLNYLCAENFRRQKCILCLPCTFYDTVRFCYFFSNTFLQF